MVYPEKSLKEEWIGRCFLRGSGEKFCQLIADNWNNWMEGLEEDSKRHKSMKLRSGEHLSDVINFMNEYYESK